MIIYLIMQVLFMAFSILTTPIDIPSLPDGVTTIVEGYFYYLQQGFTILAVYVDLNYLFTLFGLILLVDVGLLLYKFVMWILRKIPLLGIN